ncbi:hypothetical protein TNCV_2007541 [Trichonephila clavipes]|nr:hypothetical protein TNCV_2007541 [Trichonephila clavipes]
MATGSYMTPTYSRVLKCPVSYTAWIAFSYPNNRISEWCPVPIDSDKRRSTVLTKTEEKMELRDTRILSCYMVFNDFKAELNQDECVQRLQLAFGDEPTCYATVFRWFQEFRSGRSGFLHSCVFFRMKNTQEGCSRQ